MVPFNPGIIRYSRALTILFVLFISLPNSSRLFWSSASVTRASRHFSDSWAVRSSQEDVSRHQLVEMYTEMIGSYFNTKKLILKDHYIELRFEDLINDPLSELKKIYQQFNILTFEKDLPKFRTFLSQTKKHSNNRYEISDQTVNLVNEHLLEIVKKWNYEVKQ